MNPHNNSPGKGCVAVSSAHSRRRVLCQELRVVARHGDDRHVRRVEVPTQGLPGTLGESCPERPPHVKAYKSKIGCLSSAVEEKKTPPNKSEGAEN